MPRHEESGWQEPGVHDKRSVQSVEEAADLVPCAADGTSLADKATRNRGLAARPTAPVSPSALTRRGLGMVIGRQEMQTARISTVLFIKMRVS